MRKISPKNLLVLFAARQTILLFNLAREQKSLATPAIDHKNGHFFPSSYSLMEKYFNPSKTCKAVLFLLHFSQ